MLFDLCGFDFVVDLVCSELCYLFFFVVIYCDFIEGVEISKLGDIFVVMRVCDILLYYLYDLFLMLV